MHVHHLSITAVSSVIGAIINGIDLSYPIPDTIFASIKQAFIDHGVIFFKDQNLTPQQYIAFAKRWATPEIDQFIRSVSGYPEITEVRKDPGHAVNIGGNWHTDRSYNSQPPMASMLLAREIPPYGGDTLFANMYMAYETLSQELKRSLTGLNAVHGISHNYGFKIHHDTRFINPYRTGLQEVVHPVVIQHPESGRKVLYVNPGFTLRIDGWGAQESKDLLQTLYQHATKSEFSHQFSWTPGMLLMWDNRCTMHRALNDYQGHRRVMHRITLQGSSIIPSQIDDFSI
jgi:taurine dioxygenase